MLSGYTYQKFDVLINKKDVKVLSTEIDSAIADTDVYDTSNGIKIAVAFSAYDDNTEPILEESLGRVVFSKWHWGARENGTTFSSKEEIPSQYCSREELGLENAKDDQPNVFYPIAKRYEHDFDTHAKKFRCISADDMLLNGDYNSVTASLIDIKVEKCHDKDYCKTQEEIDDFFERKYWGSTEGNYIIMLTNQVRFDTEKFHQESIVKESVLKWIPLDL